jgi:hypothetical protein
MNDAIKVIGGATPCRLLKGKLVPAKKNVDWKLDKTFVNWIKDIRTYIYTH